MDVGLEVGNRWGECFPFKVDQETGEILEPDGEPVAHAEAEPEHDNTEMEDLEKIEFDFDLD